MIVLFMGMSSHDTCSSHVVDYSGSVEAGRVLAPANGVSIVDGTDKTITCRQLGGADQLVGIDCHLSFIVTPTAYSAREACAQKLTATDQ